MFEIFHHPFSVSSRFTRLVAGEYGLNVKLIIEPFRDSDLDFLRMKPGGLLPVVLENGGEAIYGAIPFMEYVYETRLYKVNGLMFMPEHPYGRAEVRRLVELFLVRCDFEALSHLVHEKILKLEISYGTPEREPDSKILRLARANVRRYIGYLSKLILTKDWLSGSKHMTFADLAAASVLSILDYLGELDWNRNESLKHWYQRIKSRPSFRTLLLDRAVLLPPSATYVDLDF